MISRIEMQFMDTVIRELPKITAALEKIAETSDRQLKADEEDR